MTVTQDAAKPDQIPTTLPAGGPDAEHFDWAEAWYPVHYVEDLDKTRPTRFTLLEQDLVIWWDPNADNWRVFVDQCPHRLAPLSEGRVNEAGLLECPYHGWAFAGNGTCEHIPQAAPELEAQRSNRACAKSLPTTTHQGLLFVYPGKAENAEKVAVPGIDPLEEDPDGWVLLNTFRDLPYDALTLLENVLDASHIPYTHHKTVGKRENAAPMEMEVLTAGKQGFTGIWPEGPRKGKLGTQHTTFVAPSLMYHDLTSKQFGRTLTVVYAVPTRKGECRLFARFPFKFSSKLPSFFIKLTPRWYSHIGNNRVLEDDQIFLHIQERMLEKAGNKSYAQACYLPTPADRYVMVFRQWIRDFSADPFPRQALPAEWSKLDLLDRYHSHTQHCGSCRPALANIQKLRQAALIFSALIWSALPLSIALQGTFSLTLGISLTALPIAAGALWLWLGKLEQKFYKGDGLPPRNLPE
ncbi:aromatic ring-hydroxylating dioxygenase subunit alpha [Leptolyngbya iicbica]|uniref:Cell death suppressor protein Lls1 n=2 Tax=Cyanophyceae TaxID=3028117 RepID=A0A4Q7E271_9CYAN|nr:Rieske 2Fe-2S domain-containing protein [Leptolyngbya sp. LK]RZM76510.1 cell death suppressor protein Lls1 [Leptolyngbya sp. LK]